MTGVGFRPEVQALRALAVAMVVVNHLWPAQLPGGFAGVDVFFVISGFLITGHLTRELVATGRLDLPTFWSRRVRRLLPAALVVLAACLALTVVTLPSSEWRENLGQIVASTFYVENWVLVASSTDYFAAENSATTVQHFWSLSVEEQFYLVWPLVLVAAVWFATRRSGSRESRMRRTIAATIAVTGLASLTASVLVAGVTGGYFSTATRVWEFMAGAALVFVPALSLVLAGLTKRYVEERFRRAPAGIPRARNNRRALLLPAVAGVAMLAAVGTVTAVLVTPRAQAVEQAFDALRHDGCLGADAVVNGCDEPFGAGPTLDPMRAAADRVPVCDSSLGSAGTGDTAATCVYGDTMTTPVIAVVGDSHAQIIASSTARWALDHGYSVTEFTSPACPVIATQRLTFPHANRATTAESVESWEECRERAERVLSDVAEDTDVVGVVVTNATRTYVDEEAPDRSILTIDVAERALRELSRDSRPVLVVRDVPGLDFDQGTAPQCLAQHPDDLSACTAPRVDVTLVDDPMLVAAQRVGAATLDLSDVFCDAVLCYPVVGGVIAYWDRAHLTRTMADTLEPIIDDALAEAFGGDVEDE